MAEYYENGNYQLHELTLVNYRGETFDLRGIFSYIEVYEDIFSTTISARIGVEDAVDLYQSFPIIGKEKLILSYSTTDFDKVRIELSVYDIPNREQIKTKHDVYILSFMSAEGLVNQHSTMRRSLAGNVAESVKSILQTELESTKEVFTDPIATDLTYIPPRQRPFETINTLLNRSISASSATHADLVLFETVDGYNISSLNRLVTQEPSYTYKFGRLNKESDGPPLDDEFEIIGNYQIIQESAPAMSIASGAYGCTMGTFDPVSRTYKESTYDAIENKDDFNYLGTSLKIPDNDAAQKASKDAVFKYVIAGTKEATYMHRNAKLEQLFNNIKIVADVAGNSDLRVGDVIQLDLPSGDPEDNQKAIEERFLTGKYLLSSLKHTFKVGVGGYRTIIELVRDSTNLSLDDSKKLFAKLKPNNVV
jgi:hypothetical protein